MLTLGCPTTRAIEHTLCSPPTASAPPPHSPTRPAAASCAGARAQALSGVTDAWDSGRGSSLPLLTLGCPTTRALEHRPCALSTASAAPTHSPARPAATHLRARAQAVGGVTNAWDFWVGPHEFPCSPWGIPPLGLVLVHHVHLPTRTRPPHTHPPASGAVSCARAGTWSGGNWRTMHCTRKLMRCSHAFSSNTLGNHSGPSPLHCATCYKER